MTEPETHIEPAKCECGETKCRTVEAGDAVQHWCLGCGLLRSSWWKAAILTKKADDAGA